MITINKLIETTQHIDSLDTIIFDMDDTLYGEKEYVLSGYHQIAQKFPEIKDMEECLWQAFLDGKPAIDAVLDAKGLATKENKELCLQTYRFQIPDIHLYPEVKELLTTLKEQGFNLGLITDGRPEGQRAKIKALGLSSYFEEIIITDELGGIDFRKPNSLAFEIMSQRFNCSFEQMCYIGDNLNKDFIAPEKLGMKSIYFRNKDGLYFKE